MEDEEVAESWEEAADSGEIERRLEAKLMISQKEKKSNSGSGRSPMRTAIVIQDDSLPAAPAADPHPEAAPSNGSLGSGTTSTRPVPQVKSLAQREAEYAEARRRILGSPSPEDAPQERPSADRPVRMSAPASLEDCRPNNHAIRQPTGPDGTQGFRQRR